MACAVAFGASSALADEGGAGVGQTPESTDPADSTQAGLIVAASPELQSGDNPSSFDLRNVDGKSFVTPVRAQYPFSTCWGFAATASAENSIIAGEDVYDTDPPEDLNFSEKHLAYFSTVFIQDESNPQYGEGFHTYSEDAPSNLLYNVGGSIPIAASLYASGVGPVFENRSEDLVYKGKPGNIVQKEDAQGDLYDYSYSGDDDWSLDESMRFMSDYVLIEASELPSPAPNAGEQNYDEDAVAQIKEQLANHRIVTVGFHADTSRPWEDPSGKDGDYMSTQNWAHYTYDNALANHAVAIVGWDDNYPATNFPEAHQPPGDGAWLVKNSWGAGTNEFPNKGTGHWGIPVTDEGGTVVLGDDGEPLGSGYFWLSYYDRSVISCEVLVFATGYFTDDDPGTHTDGSWHRDQHDLMTTQSYATKTYEESAKSANIFAPDGDEVVSAVIYRIPAPGTVTWKAYILNEDATTPEEGVLVAQGSESHERAGLYLGYPDQAFVVYAGQKYSIVVETKDVEGKSTVSAGVSLGDCLMAPYLLNGRYAKAVVNQGESALYEEGVWKDWSDEDLRQEFGKAIQQTTVSELMGALKDGALPDMPDISGIDTSEIAVMVIDNFPIKGIAFDAANDIRAVLAEGSEVHMRVGETVKDVALKAVGTGSENIDLNKYMISWFLEDGDDELVAFEAGEDNTKVNVTGLKVGRAHLVAQVIGLGTVIIPVVVEAAAPSDDDGDSGGSSDPATVKHTVAFDANGHGEAPDAQTVEDGKVASKPADPKADGYTFDGWYTDKDCKNAYDFSAPVTEDITLYAKWTEDAVAKHTVTFDANGHGTAPAAQTVEDGGKASRPANPTASGYTFGGWYTDKACTKAYDFSTPVTSDLTLYAKWAKKSSSGSSTSPRTGDPLGGALAIALALAAASALALVLSRRKLRG